MQQYYDVIVLGESLTSRIAAVLLARGGCRVLTFREPEPPTQDWLWPSLHLERLLERLEGRSCFVPPSPYQVLTRGVRLEINGADTLEEELRREFGSAHARVADTLERLRLLGQHLEETLWESAPPLLGIGSRLRFAEKRLLRRLPSRLLRRPFREALNGHDPGPGRDFLTALFSGLALRPAERLSMAEAALLWHGAGKNVGVSRAALDELLTRRYGQFHGEEADFDRLSSLEARENALQTATLADGRKKGAQYFLFGTSSALELLPQNLRRPPLPTASSPVRFVTSPLGDKVSPLLAPWVILDAERPLRIRFAPNNHDLVAVIDDIAAEQGETVRVENLREQLKEILPFADFRLERFSPEALPSAAPSSPGGPPPCGRRFPGAQAALKIQGNRFCCEGARIFPALGTTGEILAGIAVGRHLLRRLKKPVEI